MSAPEMPPTSNTSVLSDPLFWGLILVNVVWVLLVLRHYGAFRRRYSSGNASFTPSFGQRGVESQAGNQKLTKENERLHRTVAEYKRKEVMEDIRRKAADALTAMLPKEISILDPYNQIMGRPIYFAGNKPTIDKQEVLTQIVEASFLAKLSRSLATRLYNWLYFGAHDTLYYYTPQLLSDGNWVITATTKPAKKTRHNTWTIPAHCKQYLLPFSAHRKIDELILNKYEVINEKAAITLASEFVGGPFSIEEYVKHMGAVGFEKYITTKN